MIRLRLTVVVVAALVCLIVGAAAQAAPDTYCSPPTGTTGSTTYVGADGSWGDGDNWSAGLPDAQCEAVIPANTTVTFSTTPDGHGANDDAASMAGLTISAGATLIVEGVSSDVQGNASNSTTVGVGVGGLTIAAGATLDLEATGNVAGSGASQPGGSANVVVDSSSSTPAPLNNQGTIEATSTDSAWGESLGVGGTLTNSGSILDQSGTLTLQGQGNLPYVVENTGTFSVASGAGLTMLAGDGSSFTNSGTFANQGTTTVNTAGTMDWAQSGGSETGNPVTLEGALLQDSAGTGAFDFANCGGFLDGTIPAGQTVTVTGGCSGTTLTLGTRDGGSSTVVNHGTLVLDASRTGGDAILAGGELENDGTLNSVVDGAAPLDNQLLVALNNEAGGTVNLTGGELAQTTGSTTSNAGSVNIGPGATWLVQGGAFKNTGALSPQISGATKVGTLNLTTYGKFTAGGTLAPALESGYVPAKGTEFRIITLNGGSVSGTFGSVTGGFSADDSHEATSPAYVGVVYSGALKKPTPSPSPSVRSVKGGSGEVTATVSCPPGGSRCAAYKITGTVTEHLKGSKVTAVTARKTKAKSKPKTKVVVVASGTGIVAALKSVKVTLKLDKTGSALLKRFGKLKVLVTVTSAGKTVKNETVTVTDPKAKKKE